MYTQLITSTILILTVLFIRSAFGRFMSQKLTYSLWVLVAVKLLLPMPMVENEWNIMNVLQMSSLEKEADEDWKIAFQDGNTFGNIESDMFASQKSNNTSYELQKADSEESIVNNGQNNKNNTTYDMAQNLGEERVAGSQITSVCRKIWLFGMCLLGGCLLGSNLLFASRLRKERRLQGRYERLNVYQSINVNTPCLFGLFSPAIYLPSGDSMVEDNREYVILHEWIHFRHKDYIWAFIRCVCLTVYWFHPLVWVACILSMCDAETACDEDVIRVLGEEHRKEYGKMLLSMIELEPSKGYALQIFSGILGGKREMKQRMKMIVKKRKTKAVIAAMAFLALAGVFVVTFGMAKAQSVSESADTIASETIFKTERIEEQNEESLSDGLEWCSSPDEERVSIKISLPTNAEGKMEYIVFGGEIQEKLTQFAEKLNPSKEETEKLQKQWLKVKELGFELHYKGKIWTAYADGYFQLYSADLKLLCQTELSEFVLGLLQNYADYEPINLASIKNIASATMAYTPKETKKYSQTISDEKELKKIEKWISEAEYVRGGSGCPFGEARLILTLENGKSITLDMATDSCMIFGINGVYYEYDANVSGKGYDNELWSLFDELPKLSS